MSGKNLEVTRESDAFNLTGNSEEGDGCLWWECLSSLTSDEDIAKVGTLTF